MTSGRVRHGPQVFDFTWTPPSAPTGGRVEGGPTTPDRAGPLGPFPSGRPPAGLPGQRFDDPAPGVGRPPRAAPVSDPLPKKADAEHDYVVVGGGGAGAITAARLAEDGYSVLVLEAGHDTDVVQSHVPAAHAIASEHPDLSANGEGYFVDHFSDPARQAEDPKLVEGRGIFYPRGAGVGGSTRMNAMIFVRPDDVDWDHVAQVTGDDSWSAENMQPYLNRLEDNRYRPILRLLHRIGQGLDVEALQNIGGHGFDGWLETNRADPKLLLQDKQLLRMAVKTATWSLTRLGSLGDRVKRLLTTFDPNDTLAQGTEGLTLTPMSVTGDGRRNGPRDRLLDVAAEHPDRVEIRTGAKVDRVLLDGDQEAVGVRYRDAQGKLQTVGTRREVLLAAGAFESPAVLLRSGIGSEAQLSSLAEHGVEPKVIRPGVGESLSDRYEYGLVFRLKQPLDLVKDLALTFDDDDPTFQQWKAEGGTPYASNGAVLAFQAKSDPSLDDPDLFMFLVPGKFDGYKPGYAEQSTEDPNLLTLVILDENKRDKKGTVRVDASDPNGPPKINFAYHEEESTEYDDRLPLARGVQMGRELIARFGDMVEQEILPGPQVQTLEEIADEVGKGSWGHHANGTAKMGKADDPNAVVDSKLNVIGTKGLRVIDASTFPRTPGAFIVSAVMMQAEKAADLVKTTAEAQDALAQAPVASSR